MAETGQGAGRARRVGLVALLLAASTALSRLLGLLREAVFAAQVGAGSEADAYRAAFLIPDVLNHFLAGGALSIAFIPFYTRCLDREGAERAQRLFAVVLGTLGAAVLLATGLLWWQAEALVAAGFGSRGGFAPEVQARVVVLTRILLPAQIFFVLGGVLRGVLMAHDRFATQAAAGPIYNLCIIAGGLLGGAGGAEGFAWGALVGACVGPFALPLLDLLRSGVVRLRVALAPFDRDFLAYLVIAAPLMIGFGMLTVDDWFDKLFGARLGPSVVAYLGFARQLMLTPVGVIGQAIATAALPTLSRLWAQRQIAELDALVLGTLRAGLGLAILAGAACFVLAGPIVTLVFERGRFSAADAEAVTSLLRVFCFAVPGWILSQIAPRPFYARQDMWRPMLLSTAVALAMAPLYGLLGRRFGAEGLAAAGALGMSLGALALLLLARRLHGAPDLVALAASGLRTLAIALPSALLGYGLPVPAGEGFLAALLELLLRGVVMAVAMLAGVHWLGDAETRAALARITGRLRRAS